jgi:phage terminase small subunit
MISSPKPSKNPPNHLSSPAKAWFSSVIADYDLEPHHVRLLTAAAELWDRGEQARKVIGKEGLTFVDRFGQPRERPEVGIERNSRLAFAKLLREMNLDIDPPSDSRLPRGGRYNHARS